MNHFYNNVQYQDNMFSSKNIISKNITKKQVTCRKQDTYQILGFKGLMRHRARSEIT